MLSWRCDGELRRKIYEKMAEGNILLDKRIEETAEEIRSKSSIKLFDSLHLAAAEVNGIDYFITTDDRFLSLISAVKDSGIKIASRIYVL